MLPVGPLLYLGGEYCSLGQSFDYYERLASLPKQVRDEILTFLGDVLFAPEHLKRFEAEDGWKTSLTRDIELDSYSPVALTLLHRDYSALPSVGLLLEFQMAGWEVPLSLNFAAPTAGGPLFLALLGPRLPERVAVLTGRNGSGKSTLLARLARVLHASQADRRRDVILRLGKVDPPGIGFTRIIALGYSAFDTFQVPGVSSEEKRQIISDLRAGTGRYIFAGLRDIARELEEQIGGGAADQNEAHKYSDDMDRQNRTYLKSIDALSGEYSRTIARIISENRLNLLVSVFGIAMSDPSFSDFSENPGISFLERDQKTLFMSWSTGHKIVMHALATLVAHAQPKSIVLLDEPESHLHPPLLAAFMHALRKILDTVDAFAVVATHSPVVAQETLGRHVSVISRNGDVVTILPPKVETYGESIGEITDEVFGLTAGSADFHTTLRGFVERGLSLVQIESRFDRGLSLQARAFVMSLIASRAR